MNLYFTYECHDLRQLETSRDRPRPLPAQRSRPAVPAPTPTATAAERYVIPNLRNACHVLKLLGQQSTGLKAAEIARALRLPVTSTLRIMSTLLLEGFVRKTDGRFELGPVLIQLGTASLSGTEIRDIALPLLERLTAATDETSHLAIPCDDRSLIVAVQDSPHPLRASSRPGFLADLHCSSTGKIFLTYLHADRLTELYGRTALPARTPSTLTTLAALRHEIEATRKRGYSLDNEEFNPGVRCLAVPVFGPEGSVVAAIGITAATVRFPRARVPEVAATAVAIAKELSQLIGHA